MNGGVVVGSDGISRCPWSIASPDYMEYHDLEWGRHVRGDAAIFERISLEAFQSGLSWLTILAAWFPLMTGRSSKVARQLPSNLPSGAPLQTDEHTDKS